MKTPSEAGTEVIPCFASEETEAPGVKQQAKETRWAEGRAVTHTQVCPTPPAAPPSLGLRVATGLLDLGENLELRPPDMLPAKK